MPTLPRNHAVNHANDSRFHGGAVKYDTGIDSGWAITAAPREIQSQQGRLGIPVRIETEQGFGTREPLSRYSTKENKALSEPLPTPINVNSLERVLFDYPDHLFVSC